MPPARVLVVDDSVVARRVLRDALDGEPDLAVVGCAPNGRIGVRKAAELQPDVVVLDVEMPELGGLDTLSEIRRRWPRLPVIMFSRMTERGASVTMDALLRGASDYCPKPAGREPGEGAEAQVRSQLVPKIRALCAAAPPPAAASRPASQTPAPAEGGIEAVLIGSSTGGPAALNTIVAALPAALDVPILVTQHMPPMFTRLLAERLDARGGIRFCEAQHAMPIERGRGYVAPGGRHLLVAGTASGLRIALDDRPPENSCRPSVDPMLRSAAAALGPRLLAVILTGMGQDGLRGCERVREAGGRILVQDEATSVVWGMPGLVARAGLADEILPLSEIAPAILARVRRAPAETLTAVRDAE